MCVNDPEKGLYYGLLEEGILSLRILVEDVPHSHFPNDDGISTAGSDHME